MSKEVNKNLYKIFLIIIKYIPSVLSLIHIISLALNYYGIPTTILSCLGGSSILFLAVLWLIAYVFKYCYLYKIPLAFDTSVMVINLIKFSGVIALNALDSYRIHAIVIGLFISLFVAYRYKNRHKSNEDVDKLCKFLCGD